MQAEPLPHHHQAVRAEGRWWPRPYMALIPESEELVASWWSFPGPAVLSHGPSSPGSSQGRGAQGKFMVPRGCFWAPPKIFLYLFFLFGFFPFLCLV